MDTGQVGRCHVDRQTANVYRIAWSVRQSHRQSDGHLQYDDIRKTVGLSYMAIYDCVTVI